MQRLDDNSNLYMKNSLSKDHSVVSEQNFQEHFL